MDYVKDRSLILGLIEITKQVETLLFLQKTLRTETSFSVRSESSSRWKPYSNKEKSKNRNLILSLIKIIDQVETLLLLQRTLKTETPFSVRSKLLSRWKPYYSYKKHQG